MSRLYFIALLRENDARKKGVQKPKVVLVLSVPTVFAAFRVGCAHPRIVSLAMFAGLVVPNRVHASCDSTISRVSLGCHFTATTSRSRRCSGLAVLAVLPKLVTCRWHRVQRIASRACAKNFADQYQIPEGFEFVAVVHNSPLQVVSRWRSKQHGAFDISDHGMVRECMAFKVVDETNRSFEKRGNWSEVLAQVDGNGRTQDILFQLAGIKTEAEKYEEALLATLENVEFTEIPEWGRRIRIPAGVKFHSMQRGEPEPVTRWETEHYGFVDVSESIMAREAMAFAVQDPSGPLGPSNRSS